MVNESGQLYTIEGFAAGILMIFTAYLVVSSTTVLTPQDVHIIDMQLQQTGSDALAMMDTPDIYGTEIRNYSPLTLMIMNKSPDLFEEQFLTYVNTSAIGTSDRLKLRANISYRDTTDNIKTVEYLSHPYYRENAVKVTRWVYHPKNATYNYPDMRNTNQTVLLEVLLWRE